jgi:hypothetical protein
MSKIKCNDPQLEQVLNYLLAKVEGIKAPQISVGKGMFTPQNDGDHVLLESRGGKSAGGACRKWSVTLSGGSSERTATLQSGTINGIAASNQGEQVKLQQNAEELYLVASVSTDTGEITSWEFEAVREQPKPTLGEGYPDDFKFTVATLIGGKLKVSFCGNVTATPTVQFVTSMPKPEPGEEPFIRHFAWSLSDDGTC